MGVIEGGASRATGASAPPLLAGHGLVRRYGPRTAVDVESVAVGRGEVLGVLGPNGAGKSTLFRLLLLLERPDAGRVLLDGEPVSPGDPRARRRLVGVFQRAALFSGTVRSNVEFGLRAAGVSAPDRRRRGDRIMGDLGIDGLRDAGVRSLSGGEAQRVALARALVLEPDVLLLDEPTAGLDVTARRRFREEVGHVIRERARGVILITHDPADAFELADRVAVMEMGRIVQTGSPDELTDDPATPFVATFTGAELLLDGVVASGDEGMVVVRAGATDLLARAANAPLAPGDAVHVRYRPEDVLLATTDTAAVSARNHIAVTVRSLTPVGGLVRVRLGGPIELAALVTRDSADRLGLRPGLAVVALLKATALHAHRPHSA